jgi:hypothetical protein
LFVWTNLFFLLDGKTKTCSPNLFYFRNMSLEQIAHIPEILDRIFIHLSTPTLIHRIQLVCKQWHKVAEEHIDYAYNNNKAICWAAADGRLEIVNKLLQDPRVDPGARNNLAIEFAADYGHLAVVNRLLQDPRVDPGRHYSATIRWASLHGHLAIVNRLLEDPRVDPSAEHNDAILWASENGHIEVVKRLLQDERVRTRGTWIDKCLEMTNIDISEIDILPVKQYSVREATLNDNRDILS